MTDPIQPDPSRIIDMASAFYGSCVLFAASDLGVFAALAETGAQTAQEVAQTCGLDLRGTTLLLDGCVALELLSKDADHYANTPEAQTFLVPGSPADLSRAIRYNRDVYAAWGHLPDLAKSGEPVERPEIHLGEDDARTRAFVMSMHGRAMGIGRTVVPMLNLADCRALLDVGGGPGTYARLIATANPDLHCTVVDLPAVSRIAEELTADADMAGRVTHVPGDYHTFDFPPAQDAVSFFGVLHQESPDSIRDLLRRACEALNPGGVVHVLDMMTDATHTSPTFSALFAVNMALTTEHGWVFSDAELGGWLKGAGFVDVQVTPLPPPMPHWLVTARKP